MSWPDTEAAYVQSLREAALRRPTMFLARNTAQARLASEHAPEVNLVFSSYVNPQTAGIVSDLVRHSERATGIWIADHMDPKRLELLLDAFPGLTQVGLIADPDWDLHSGPVRQELGALAAARGVQLQVLVADSIESAQMAVDTPSARTVQAWCVPRTSLSNEPELINQLSRQGRLVMTAHVPDVRAEAHLAYALDRSALYADLADVVARVLQGESARDIPVQTPRRFQLAIRLSDDARLPRLNPEFVRRADVVVRP